MKTLKEADTWCSYSAQIEIPDELLAADLAVILRFCIRSGEPVFHVDDVSLTEAKSDVARVAAGHAVSPARKDWLRVTLPDDLPPEQAAWYAPFPELGFEFGMRDGYLTRDGKPFFYVGSNNVGGGQANVASTWLARVMRHSFSEVNRGIGGAMRVAREGDSLAIGYNDAAPSYSVLRELARNHLIAQFDCGNAQYKYIAN